MSTLRINTHLTAFDDIPANNNPSRRSFDWGRDMLGIPISNPRSESISIPAFQDVVIFNGSRVLTADGTTEFEIDLSSLDSSRYRMAWTGTGTAPGFRTDRLLTLSGGIVSIVVNPNSTITMTHDGGAVFGTVSTGDTVLIPGAVTGDTSLFSGLNEGEWVVLSAVATALTLVRASGVVFSAKTEDVTITADSQVVAYSSSGVQVGDTLDLTAGFASTSVRTYTVLVATANYLEFVSTSPIAEETVIPGAGAVNLYQYSKGLLYIESDQEVALKINGDTTEKIRLTPTIPGDVTHPGVFMKTGAAFSLTIKNRSTVNARVTVISAE